MFVQHSVHVGRPIEEVGAAIASDARKWFPRLDDEHLTTVGPRLAGVGVRKKVSLEVGDPVTAGSWTEVPITWHATFIKNMFPVMTGKVELAPVDGRNTRLTVCGMYQPPLGRVGRTLDEALMHKVAEATVKDLAESIARRLVTPPSADVSRSA